MKSLSDVLRAADMFGPNRVLCECLSEMRDLVKSSNRFNLKRTKNVMLSLLDEIQVYANRMEAGLMDKTDLMLIQDKLREEKKKLEVIQSVTKSLEKDDE